MQGSAGPSGLQRVQPGTAWLFPGKALVPRRGRGAQWLRGARAAVPHRPGSAGQSGTGRQRPALPSPVRPDTVRPGRTGCAGTHAGSRPGSAGRSFGSTGRAYGPRPPEKPRRGEGSAQANRSRQEGAANESLRVCPPPGGGEQRGGPLTPPAARAVCGPSSRRPAGETEPRRWAQGH